MSKTKVDIQRFKEIVKEEVKGLDNILIKKKAVYQDILVEQRADPYIILANDGYYYFTGSYPTYGAADKEGYDRIVLRRAKTIDGLKDAKEITIWNQADSTISNKFIWAPELHFIGGKWYVLYSGSGSANNVWDINCRALRCTGNDPYSDKWEEIGKFEGLEGDENRPFSNFSLDMTYFENNGKHFVAWAQSIGTSNIYMATINADKPWILTSKAIKLTSPEYDWERKVIPVNEGPSILKHGDRIFMVFSASATGPEYCLGMLYADINSDLMDINSWTKVKHSLLTSEDLVDEYGPGHNSFTKDEYGNDIFVYHSRSKECFENNCQWAKEDPLHDPCRSARVRKVEWTDDNFPILNGVNAPNYLVAYARKNDEQNSHNSEVVTNSLHLALVKNGQINLLNSNTGVLFASTSLLAGDGNSDKDSDGISVANGNNDGNSDENSEKNSNRKSAASGNSDEKSDENGNVTDYKMLQEYELKGVTLLDIKIASLGNSYAVVAKLGDNEGRIIKEFEDKYVFITTNDFLSFSSQRLIGENELKEILSKKEAGTSIAGNASDAENAFGLNNIIEIKETEVINLLERYGDSKELKNEDYKDFLIDNYADPVVVYNPDNKKYYFMATTGLDNNTTLTIREADSVNELSNAKAFALRGEEGYSYELGVNDDDNKLLLWAPELHKIGDYWYVLFASGSNNWDGQCCYIMKNKTGNLMDKNAWEDAILVKDVDGISPLYKKGITLDMTYIHDNNKHYVIWANRETISRGGDVVGSSDLFIATIDKDDPSVITSEKVMIAKPEYGFELRTTAVLEGPFAIKKNGNIYLSYSGSGVDETYCVGLLIAKEGTNLLDPTNWKKLSSPILTTESGGEKGPGHCSFTVDEYGNEIFIYHFFKESYVTRSARARRLDFSRISLPILNN